MEPGTEELVQQFRAATKAASEANLAAHGKAVEHLKLFNEYERLKSLADVARDRLLTHLAQS